jgi:hypothetical protein
MIIQEQQRDVDTRERQCVKTAAMAKLKRTSNRVWKKPAHTVSSHRLITTTASTIEPNCLINTNPRSVVCNEPPKIKPSTSAITGRPNTMASVVRLPGVQAYN